MTALASVLTLLVLAAAPTEVPLKGTLCVGASGATLDQADRDCTKASGDVHAVTAEASPRPYVWYADDGSVVRVGTIPANAKQVTLGTSASPALALRLRASDNKRWPAPVTITVATSKETVARFVMPAAKSSALKMLRTDPGAYTLTFAAEGHAPATRSATLKETGASLGDIVLERHPEISGLVIRSADEQPVAGAVITTEDDVVLGTSGPAGRFAVTIDDKWPATLKVAASTFGTRILSLPRIKSDVAFPPVRMAPAGELSVAVTAERPLPELKLVLSSVGDKPIVVRRATLNEANEVTLTDLSPGSYQVTISGTGPLQKFVKNTTVKSSERTAERIVLAPVRLEIIVGDSPRYPSSSIMLQNASMGWSSLLTTGAEGAAVEELWQEGDYAALVNVPERPVGIFAERKIGADADLTWNIPVPNEEVRGRVTDATTGAPIVAATVYLDLTKEGTSALIKSTTDDAGSFAFRNLDTGVYSLTVLAPDYLTSKMAVPPNSREPLAVAMRRGVARKLAIRSAANQPLAGALVVDETGNPLNPVFTDASGSATVVLEPKKQRTFYILPKEGSFAIVTLRPDEDAAKVVDVQVPAGEARMRVRARANSNAGIENVTVLFRYNGQFIPFSVAEAMMRQQGNQFRTDATGTVQLTHLPLGMYEIWPIFRREDAQAASIGSVQPAARVAARPGDNEVDMMFKPAS